MKYLFVGDAHIEIKDNKAVLAGSAARMAMSASKLGVKPSLVAPLSKSQQSKKYIDQLQNAGVDISLSDFGSRDLPLQVTLKEEDQERQEFFSDNGSLTRLSKIRPHHAELDEFHYIFLCLAPEKVIKNILEHCHQQNLIFMPGSNLIDYEGQLLSHSLDHSLVVSLTSQEFEAIESYKPVMERDTSMALVFQDKQNATLKTRAKQIPIQIPKSTKQLDLRETMELFTLTYAIEYGKYNNMQKAIETAKNFVAEQDGSVSSS